MDKLADITLTPNLNLPGLFCEYQMTNSGKFLLLRRLLNVNVLGQLQGIVLGALISRTISTNRPTGRGDRSENVVTNLFLLWSDISSQDARQLIYPGSDEQGRWPTIGQPPHPQMCYISIGLNSRQLESLQSGRNKFSAIIGLFSPCVWLRVRIQTLKRPLECSAKD